MSTAAEQKILKMVRDAGFRIDQVSYGNHTSWRYLAGPGVVDIIESANYYLEVDGFESELNAAQGALNVLAKAANRVVIEMGIK